MQSKPSRHHRRSRLIWTVSNLIFDQSSSSVIRCFKKGPSSKMSRCKARKPRFLIIEATFRNNKTNLEVIATVEQDKKLAVAEKAKRLGRIVVALGEAHPKNVDRCTEVAELEFSARMSDRMPAVGADHQIGMHGPFAVRRFCAHACDAAVFEQKIDNLVLHVEREGGKAFRLCGKKAQKIPLRHKRDELATRRQAREIGDRNCVTIENATYFAQFLVRQFQEFLEQIQLVHQLKCGRMNGVAPEIAVEIGMLLQHGHVHTGAGQEITGHHSSGSATDDDAASADVRQRAHKLDL